MNHHADVAALWRPRGSLRSPNRDVGAIPDPREPPGSTMDWHVATNMTAAPSTAPSMRLHERNDFARPRRSSSSSAAAPPRTPSRPGVTPSSQPPPSASANPYHHLVSSGSPATQMDGPEDDKDDDIMSADGGTGVGADATSFLPEYPHSTYNYGTWSAADDRTLVLARERGQHWAALQQTYFPTKTANACRKRYERLMERRGVYNHDARRMERIAYEYMSMRKQLWTPLAERVGEKWNVVEAQCMSAGLRTIQSNARSYTNRWRRESRASQKPRVVTHGGESGSVGGAGPMPLPLSPDEVVDEFGTTGFADGEVDEPSARGGGGVGIPVVSSPPGRPTSAEAMPPPPFLPGSLGGTGPQPRVTFGGYLNGKSSKTTARQTSSGVAGAGRGHPRQDAAGWTGVAAPIPTESLQTPTSRGDQRGLAVQGYGDHDPNLAGAYGYGRHQMAHPASSQSGHHWGHSAAGP